MQVFKLALVVTALLMPGCRPSGNSAGVDPLANLNFPIQAGKYTVLGIRTDNVDLLRASSNAEDAITTFPNIACMVGLWEYNPPAILRAVKGAGKEGRIAVVGFDENTDTLAGIIDGHIHGTIVQQPFLFGYKSVEYMAAMVRGQEVDVPDHKLIYVPHLVIKQDNAEQFSVDVENMRTGKGTPPEHQRADYDTSQKVRVAFLTNSVNPFWTLARQGVRLAEPDFNAECRFYEPPNGTVEEQNREVEDLITDQYEALAISPIDPANQTAIINQVCEVMPVICQDSDAPDSQRRFYLGTGNYMAGRAAGRLVKEAIPDGGEVMIFVGKLEVLNARERSTGVIDELLDEPLPEEFADAEQ